MLRPPSYMGGWMDRLRRLSLSLFLSPLPPLPHSSTPPILPRLSLHSQGEPLLFFFLAPLRFALAEENVRTRAMAKETQSYFLMGRGLSLSSFSSSSSFLLLLLSVPLIPAPSSSSVLGCLSWATSSSLSSVVPFCLPMCFAVYADFSLNIELCCVHGARTYAYVCMYAYVCTCACVCVTHAFYFWFSHGFLMRVRILKSCCVAALTTITSTFSFL